MILLAALALAADPAPVAVQVDDRDPPRKPAPAAPVANECSRAIPIVASAPLPPELAGGKASCGGVLLPSSDVADLLAIEVWSTHLDGACRVDLAAAAVELRAAEERATWYRAQAERRRVDPAVLVGAGVIGGVLVTVAGAYAVSLVAQ